MVRRFIMRWSTAIMVALYRESKHVFLCVHDEPSQETSSSIDWIC